MTHNHTDFVCNLGLVRILPELAGGQSFLQSADSQTRHRLPEMIGQCLDVFCDRPNHNPIPTALLKGTDIDKLDHSRISILIITDLQKGIKPKGWRISLWKQM